MKKSVFVCAALGLAMAFTGCKSSESAYKQAYNKAKMAEEQQQQQQAQQVQQTEVPVVTPVVTQTTVETQTPVVDNSDNVPVRQEKVSVVKGSGIRTFSVVVGSFSVIANAEGLQQRLKNAGYQALVVKNEESNMYRVIATTFDDKLSAAQSRDQLRATYPDAWLLYKVQ